MWLSWLVASALFTATYLTLGWPDIGRAASFMTSSGYQTTQEALAATAVLLWIVIVAIVAYNMATGLRGTKATLGTLAHRRQRALGYLAVGAVILAAGLVRHNSSAYSMSGGSLDEARKVTTLDR